MARNLAVEVSTLSAAERSQAELLGSLRLVSQGGNNLMASSLSSSSSDLLPSSGDNFTFSLIKFFISQSSNEFIVANSSISIDIIVFVECLKVNLLGEKSTFD